MQKLVISRGKQEYIDLTPEEEAEVQARVAEGERQAAAEAQRRADKAAALARLRASGNADLLLVLDLDEAASVRSNKKAA